MFEQYLTPEIFTPEILKIIAAVFAGFFGFKFLVKTDTKIEKRRRGAAELAGRYREMGLVTIANLLLDYSMGDYTGMAGKVYGFYGYAKENGLNAEFEAVYEKMLAAKLQDPEERAKLKERVS